jgi:hypothetical protein
MTQNLLILGLIQINLKKTWCCLKRSNDALWMAIPEPASGDGRLQDVE